VIRANQNCLNIKTRYYLFFADIWFAWVNFTNWTQLPKSAHLTAALLHVLRKQKSTARKIKNLSVYYRAEFCNRLERNFSEISSVSAYSHVYSDRHVSFWIIKETKKNKIDDIGRDLWKYQNLNIPFEHMFRFTRFRNELWSSIKKNVHFICNPRIAFDSTGSNVWTWLEIGILQWIFDLCETIGGVSYFIVDILISEHDLQF